jgi:hypothetical protein
MSNIKISFAFIIIITIFIVCKVQFMNQGADQNTNKEIGVWCKNHSLET